jgi:ferredoxin
VRGGSLLLDEIASSADLPAGWTDDQGPGHYRLARRDDQALFGHSVGAHSWKRYLFPPSVKLVEARRQGRHIECGSPAADSSKSRTAPKRYAFIGVKPCELEAIHIQDKVFLGSGTIDPVYKALREQVFIVAANCTRAAATCFCESMKTGPQAHRGFDLALTEVVGKQHYFVAESGSKRGMQILSEMPHKNAGAQEQEEAARRIQKAREQMGRRMDTAGLRDVLLGNPEHPRWDDVARRCMTCANCTMVCPTCFCSTVEDATDLTGNLAERVRRWDSCFTMEFSYIHGGCIRSSGKSRYRQWLTHKLASWNDQFGTSGCVGCGRCITWCPVGIDITEEVRAIRTTQRVEQHSHS